MSWAGLLLEQGGLLVAGASAFLALGLVVNLAQRAPIQRMRIAELALLCAMSFGALGLAPLPRPLAVWAGPLAPTERTPLPHFDPSAALAQVESARLALVPGDGAPAVAQTGTPAPASEGAAGSVATHGEGARTLESAQPRVLEGPGLGAWLLGLWAGGALLMLAWLAVGAARILRVLRRSRPAPRPLLRLLRDQGLPLPRRVRLRISDATVRPFCLGLFRPTIVLPRELVDGPHRSALAPVLRHELAHATQGDARGLWLFAVGQVVLWFHPLYWWLRHQHRFATELVADAIAAGDGSERAYARELVELVESQAARGTRSLGATALFRKRSDFYQRMHMLLTRQQILATRTSLRRRALHGVVGLTLLTSASALGGVAPAAAQEPVPEAEQIIADLRAENTQLRADLREMKVLLHEMSDTLASYKDVLLTERANAQRALDLQTADAEVQREALRSLGYLGKPTPGTPEFETHVYVVEAGDSLWSIAQRYDLLTRDKQMLLYKLNQNRYGEVDPNRMAEQPLKVGESLLIPVFDRQQKVSRKNVPLIADIPLISDLFATGQATASTSDLLTQTTSAGAGGPLPEVDLAECMEITFRVIDLEGELQLAAARLEHTQRLAEKNMVSDLELRQEAVALEALQRKHRLSRTVASARVADLKAQIAELQALADSGRSGGAVREIALREQAIQILAEGL